MLRTRSSGTLIDSRIAASSYYRVRRVEPRLYGKITSGSLLSFARLGRARRPSPHEHPHPGSRTNLALSQSAKTSYSNFAQRFSVDN